MKLLFENWRRYLNEVSFSDAKEILDSKRTLKIIKAYRYDKEKESEARGAIYGGPRVDTQHRNFKNYLLDMIPDDLTDNQKGTSVLWLLKISRENPKVAARLIDGRITIGPRQSLETFFHHQRFMPRQDLMQIKTMEDLVAMTYAAKEEIQKAQDKKMTPVLWGKYKKILGQYIAGIINIQWTDNNFNIIEVIDDKPKPQPQRSTRRRRK